MIGHELAQCRVIHAQGCVSGPQHKPSEKIISDERNQGRTTVPKQRKEYRKKVPQPKLVVGLTLNIDVPDGANAGSPLGHIASNKPGRVEDDFADMSPLENASDHESRQGLSPHTSDFPDQKMLPAIMQAKDSESHEPIEDHNVEVRAPVAVPSSFCPTSPRRAKSPGDSTTPINTPIDGHHEEISAIVTVPSPSLVLQNHFSSLKGLDSTDVGGNPYIVMTPIDDHHVEVSTPVVVSTSPRRAKSPAGSNIPTTNLIDGHHVEVSAIVIVPPSLPHTSPRKAKPLGNVKALWLILQNHFSSLDGLETTNVVSKFGVDPNEMDEDDNDIGEEIVCTKIKPGRPPKETGKSKKTAKTVLSTTSQ